MSVNSSSPLQCLTAFVLKQPFHNQYSVFKYSTYNSNTTNPASQELQRYVLWIGYKSPHVTRTLCQLLKRCMYVIFHVYNKEILNGNNKLTEVKKLLLVTEEKECIFFNGNVFLTGPQALSYSTLQPTACLMLTII